MDPRKCFALLFLSTLAFSANAEGEENVKVGTPVNINVEYPARVAVPIQFASAGYVGPYDPMDPQGLIAALHRQARVNKIRTAQVVRSYIPPGVGKFVEKESMKLAVKEGERFALSHPAETADLIGIMTKAKHLYTLGSNKLKKMEKAAAKH